MFLDKYLNIVCKFQRVSQCLFPYLDRSGQSSLFPHWIDEWGWGVGEGGWLGRGSQGMVQQRSFFSSRFRGRPSSAVSAWTGMSTFGLCPSNISSADRGVAHPPRYTKVRLGRGCRGAWYARTMQLFKFLTRIIRGNNLLSTVITDTNFIIVDIWEEGQRE